MTETKTPETTPSPAISATPAAGNSQVTVGKPENPQSVFVAMALDMSWRLAIAVLVPIIGGFELDSKLGTTPFITVLGFVVAMAGAGLVMWRTSQTASKIPVLKKTVAAAQTSRQTQVQPQSSAVQVAATTPNQTNSKEAQA